METHQKKILWTWYHSINFSYTQETLLMLLKSGIFFFFSIDLYIFILSTIYPIAQLFLTKFAGVTEVLLGFSLEILPSDNDILLEGRIASWFSVSLLPTLFQVQIPIVLVSERYYSTVTINDVVFFKFVFSIGHCNDNLESGIGDPQWAHFISFDKHNWYFVT